MFKQIKYKVVFKRGNDIEIHLVTRLDLDEMGVTKAYFQIDEEVEGKMTKREIGVPVDHVSVVLQEFTTKFDQDGISIYSGDIIKFRQPDKTSTDKALIDVFYLISFFEGGFHAINELYEQCIPLSESFCKESEYSGTIFTTPELVQKPIDESVFTPNETENNDKE